MENKPQYYKEINFTAEGKEYRGYFEPQFTEKDNHGWFASVKEGNSPRPDKLFHPDEVDSWKYRIN